MIWMVPAPPNPTAWSAVVQTGRDVWRWALYRGQQARPSSSEILATQSVPAVLIGLIGPIFHTWSLRSGCLLAAMTQTR